MKLNVGCGADTWGDVRIDLSRSGWMAKGESSLNFIADACYLPFKDKCFDELRIHEVLEHIRDWRKALLECCRVSKSISITVPVDSYMPRQYIRWFLPTLTHPRVLLNLTKSAYLKYVSGLRLRTKDHLWQFDVNTLIRTMREMGFQNVNADLTYFYFFGGSVGRRLGFYKNFRRPISWRIVASQN